MAGVKCIVCKRVILPIDGEVCKSCYAKLTGVKS